MNDSTAMLDQVVPGNNIFRIIIFDAFKRPVFPVFCFDAVHDSHSDLYIRIIRIVPAKNKVTFQFSDSAYADIVSLGSGVGINDVLQRRAIIDPFIRIQGKVKTKVCEIVFLLTGDRFAGLQIKSCTWVYDFCFL